MEKKDDVIYLDSKVNELFASTELNQYFTNTLQESIELTIIFPIKEEISLSKFLVSIDDKIILSKVMAKEKAEEKYTDAMSSGNIAFYSSYKEDQNSYSVNIGNLKPNQQIKLTTIFIQMINTQDMSYEFNIMEQYPTFHYKEINKNKPKNKTIKANFEIKTKSKITRLIAPFLDEQAKINSTYKVQYSPDYKTAQIEYIKSHDNEININNRYNNIFEGNINKPSFYSSFCILFRTEKMNQPLLYYQYNPELKETAYSINYIYTSKNLKEIPIPEKPDEDNTISYAAKYEDNITNETPGLFVFLIDQSGSMGGKSIDLVRQALLLFIQSLPANSYFQLIGFGSDFIKYNFEPVIYNKENVQNITNIINDISANLGGTDISNPLSEIYKDTSYNKINLSKNIFLLTDGQVDNRETCINLITTNASKFRVHSIGIGNDFDKILIERCGKLGKGSYSFVQDVEKINSVVIETLNKCLRPYITDIKFEFENYKEEFDSKIISCNPINNFTYQNEMMNYSFILPEKKELTNLKIKLTGKDPINIIESEISLENGIKVEDGEEMTKMIIGKALKNNDEITKDEKKEVEFAKKYQILSKNTALFAEIINDESQQSKIIKVNLNEHNQEDYEEDNYKSSKKYYRAPMVKAKKCCSSALYYKSDSKCCKMVTAAPKYSSKKKSSFLSFNLFGSSKNERRKIVDYESAPKPKENKPKKDDITSIIMSQDVIEGFWEENEGTKSLIDIITLVKFNKIKNKVIALNKGEDEIRIIYTILVMYYLNTKCSGRLNEFRLVLNKANKYLINHGIIYTDIISDI